MAFTSHLCFMPTKHPIKRLYVCFSLIVFALIPSIFIHNICQQSEPVNSSFRGVNDENPVSPYDIVCDEQGNDARSLNMVTRSASILLVNDAMPPMIGNEVLTRSRVRCLIALAKRRKSAADEIAHRIAERYFRNVSKALLKWSEEEAKWQIIRANNSGNRSEASSNRTKLAKQFAAYACEPWMVCGGYGDRLKGISTLLYFAIAARRILHADWEKPVHLNQYFHINSDWYSQKNTEKNQSSQKNSFEKIYQSQRLISRPRGEWRWLVDENIGKLKMELTNESADFVSKKEANIDSYALTVNNYDILEPLLKNPLFRNEMASIFPELIGYNSSIHVFDYSLVASGACRALMSRPLPKLVDLVESIIDTQSIGVKNWKNAIKIGIQIRTLRPKWGEAGSRVQELHFACFAEKAREIINNFATAQLTQQKVVIFVTSDSELTTDFMRKFAFKKNKTNSSEIVNYNFTVFDTDSTFSSIVNLTNVHLDRTFISENATIAWFEMAKVYVDWLLLTRMDFLLISRSGFGETASVYSQVPTWRFNHQLANNGIENNMCPFFEYRSINSEFQQVFH